MAVHFAVEGPIDELALAAVMGTIGITPGRVYGKQGKDWLRNFAPKFRQAARQATDGEERLLLADLDDEAECGLRLREAWHPDGHDPLLMPVAVREIESWLLADHIAFAGFFRVARARIPAEPDELEDPKGFLVGLCRNSNVARISRGMVPKPGSGRAVGSEYARFVGEYINRRWRPGIARLRSPSLDYCIRKLEPLVTA